MNFKKWIVKKVNKEQALAIANDYDIPTVLAYLLDQRTGGDRREIEELMIDEGFTESPFEILDMEKACDRIRDAIDNFERIAVYGDYDADGITATSILYDYLESKGADVTYYIPERMSEGYGMNKKAVEFLNSQEVKLIVTVDNGISSFDEVELANSLGMEVIVTDHHRPPEVLPNAYAVIDPYRKDCTSYFKDYCGAGIALKLILAMEFDFCEEDEILEKYSDLATIGTIADIVPLTGENRVIVKKGLASLCNSQRLGINSILEKASVANVNSTSVAFSIVPRINASGRMGYAGRSVKLLTTSDEDESLIYAEELCKENDNRKSVELEIFNDAIAKIEENPKIKYSRVIVVEGEAWHKGVIGIVASRLMERYGKPCIVISVKGDTATGSGRSFEGFSLYEAIKACSNSLSRFGGHHMAAGVGVETDKIDMFRDEINQYAKMNFPQMPSGNVYIDLKVHPSSLSVDIPEQYTVLEPFGKDNEAPVFGLYKMELQGITAVGSAKNHLRLNFLRDGRSYTCMYFGVSPEKFSYSVGNVLDLAVSLDVNFFRGEKTLSISIKAIKPSEIDTEQQSVAYGIYEKFMRGESLNKDEVEMVLPTRDDIAKVYRFIKTENKPRYTTLQIITDLKGELNIAKVIFAITALKESNLIEVDGDEFMQIKIIPATQKVDIANAFTLKKLRNFT